MFTDPTSAQGALIGLALLAFMIIRQFTTRPVLNQWMILAPFVLVILGLQSVSQLDATGWLLLGINLSLGVALGFVRGATFRVWLDERQRALMRATGLTALLWMATFGVRIGLYLVERRTGLVGATSSNVETMLPAAATLGAQLLVVYLRSRDLAVAQTA